MKPKFSKEEINDYLREQEAIEEKQRENAATQMKQRKQQEKDRKIRQDNHLKSIIQAERLAKDFVSKSSKLQESLEEEQKNYKKEYAVIEEDIDVVEQIQTSDKQNKSPNPDLLYNKPSSKTKQPQVQNGKKVKKNRLYDSEVNKRKLRNDKVGLLRYAIELLLNKITKGHYDIQTAPFEITYDQIMSKQHKKKIYHIIALPREIPYGLLAQIRLDILNILSFEDRKDADIFILHHTSLCPIDIASNKAQTTLQAFQMKLVTYQDKYKHIKECLKDTTLQKDQIRRYTSADLKQTESDVSIRERKIMSFFKSADHLSKGGTFVADYCFMELVSPKKDVLEEMQTSLEGALARYKIVNKQIVMDLQDYLREFGLGSLQGHIPKKGLDVMPMETTSDVVTSDSTYVSGLIRTRIPEIPLGMNDDNGNIVAYSYTEVADPLNILVYAQSQSGKSALIQHLWTFHNLHPKYHTIYNDMKGTDSGLISRILPDALIVPFGSKDSKILNTLHIPTKDLGFDSLEDVYELCFSTTVVSLVNLANPQFKDLTKVQSICSDIVGKAFLNYDVLREKVHTYKNSKAIPYRRALWEAIVYVTHDCPQMKKYHNEDLLRDVYIALEDYYHYYGKKSSRMKNEYDIDDLLNTNNIIFNYDSQMNFNTPAETAMLTTQKNFFSTIYTYYNCLQGEHTIEVDEEFNVQLMNPNLTEHIAKNMLMQGSHNKINYLISNSVNFLVSNKLPDGSVDKNLEAIKDSITGLIIGTNNNPDPIIEFKHLERYRDKIEKASSREDPYKYSFFVYLPATQPIRALVHLPFSRKHFRTYLKGKDIDLRGEDEYLNS